MQTSETTERPAMPEDSLDQLAAAEPVPAFEHCDECGAPVDHAQRYCVNCGTHRRHVPDPASRYLSHAGARSRALRPGGARNGAGSRRGGSLAVAVVLALIPVAAAVGVEVGRSSGNQDSKLLQADSRVIQALEREPTQTVVSSTTAGATATGLTRAASRSGTAKQRAKSSASATPAGGGKVLSSTQYGSVSQIAGSKVTAGEATQGASEAKTIQNSTGKSYVQSASNLPTTVVP